METANLGYSLRWRVFWHSRFRVVFFEEEEEARGLTVKGWFGRRWWRGLMGEAEIGRLVVGAVIEGGEGDWDLGLGAWK